MDKGKLILYIYLYIPKSITMEKRQLGSSEIQTAPLVLGTNVFAWTVDEPAAFDILDTFTEGGFNMIDTANSYPSWVPGNLGGESEAIIGNWMKERGNRDKIIIATKVGWDIDAGRHGLTKEQVTKEVEGSLKRLRTDYIDLYQSHKDDPSVQQEETLEVYERLVKEGKVRVTGASNYSAARLSEALRISEEKNYPRYQSLQPHYNLYDREIFEAKLEPLCVKEGLGVIPYFSLARGFLTGKYRSKGDTTKSSRGSSVEKFYYNERGDRILKALDEVSARHNATPAQVSLAWLMARPSVTAPISSATSVEQLKEIMKAAELKLDDEAIGILNKASSYS
jgi:aryl-alcohol dehydrogenase-like predicted oxidoreductase